MIYITQRKLLILNSEKEIQNNGKKKKKVFKEDISVVEGMQKGRKVFILMEENFLSYGWTNYCFHKWVASNLLTSENNFHEKK